MNFPFPLKIRKHEAPDFLILSSDGKMMGLEVTEASTEDHQRVMTELEKSPQGTMLMTLDLFNLEKSPLPKGEYKKALWKPGEKSIGKVWGNSEVKRVWIDIILSTIIEKTKSLNKLNFKTADRYELLVYDNSHVAEMLNSRYALPLLRKAIGEKLNLASYDRNFHSISVIHIEGLLYDVANKGLVLKAETDNTA
ncbi:hypothetical protein ISS37_09260 [candidate division KSB1 bacterium]|nr:hypothetical protein [candidate division KSB1 bacterium]